MNQDIVIAETKRLQRCNNDLVSVLALPAIWVGAAPAKIVASLLDSLLEMLDLDVVFLCINAPIGDAPARSLRVADPSAVPDLAAAAGAMFDPWLALDPESWPSQIQAGKADISILPLRLGLHGEIGLLVAGSRRRDFPQQTERLLLGVAANQAVIGLQGVRHLVDQKRIAEELDQRVAERTAELQAANAELRRQVAERKRAEENLRAQELLLGAMIESLPVPIGIMAASGECEAVNQSVLDYTGKTFEELRLWTENEVVHPDDRQATVAAWQRALESGESYQIETRLRRADGVYRWHNVHAFPMRSADSGILRWLVIQLDVHDRRDAETLLRSMIDGIAAPFTLCAPNGEMVAANRFSLEYHGKSAEEILNWTKGDMIFAADLPRVQAAWQRSLETEEPYSVEVRARRADGIYRWMHSHGFPVRDAEGQIVRWCMLHLDIDDHKVAQAAVAESERRLDLIVNTIPAMAWSADADGDVDFFNQNFIDYVGEPLDRLKYGGWKDAIHPEDIDRLLETWDSVMAAGKAGEAEARVRRFDGVYRWFLMRVSPLHDEHAKIVRWYGVNTDIEDRMRAEEAMRASELNLRQLTETIPEMLWSATPDGNIDYCNTRLLNYSNLTAETVMNGGWVNLLHPDDREPTARIWRRCVQTGDPYTVEVRHFHAADQTYRWILTMALPLRDDQGHIIKWHGTCVDIHDRKQAEQALIESERKLDQMIQTIPAVVWSTPPDGQADFFNEHYLDYVGLPFEEVAGWGWAKVIHPDDLAGLSAVWQEALISGRGGSAEARVRSADGTYRWFLFRGDALRDEAGNVLRWYGVNTDIEDLKRAEAALKASERNLRQMTETIPQMLWSGTPDGAIDYCNGRLADFTGFAAADIMGAGWKKLLHPDDVEQTARTWEACVATGEPFQVEVRIIHAADEKYRWCLTSALPLRDEQGTIVKWYGACVDAHDWKQAQDELRETQAELAHMTRVMTMGHLTASIAHELNQPLAGIIMNASTCMRMLAAEPANVAGARETARRTIRDGNRAAEVIARLRALFSKKDTAVEAVDLNTATQEVIALTLTELHRANVNLRVELADALPSVKGDRVQLQQVIMNLILNGMQAMDGVTDRAKDLVVATQRDDAGAVRLIVQDAGVGFDATAAEKLFHPFYTTKSHGMGIGLSVSRSIIENHQGRLWAERNDGPGATFLVSIPSQSGRDGAAVNA